MCQARSSSATDLDRHRRRVVRALVDDGEVNGDRGAARSSSAVAFAAGNCRRGHRGDVLRRRFRPLEDAFSRCLWPVIDAASYHGDALRVRSFHPQLCLALVKYRKFPGN